MGVVGQDGDNFMKEKDKIQELLNNLKKTFILTDEGEDVNTYLGLKVENEKDGTITISHVWR